MQPEKVSAPTRSVKKQVSGRDLKLKVLRSLKELPPMPQVVVKAQEIITNPDSSTKELARIIETDQAIVAKALKLANSAYFGLSGKVSSIDHVSVLLGYKTLGELISMAACSRLMGSTLKGYRAESGVLWRHSLAVAFGSKIIANQKKPDLASDALIAGLLHDAGKIILDQPIFERKEIFEEFMKDGKQTFLKAEKQILGFDHADIASDVCKRWRIPQSIAIPIKYHHYPSRSEGDELAYILHMADSIAMMSDHGTGIDDVLYQMDDTVMEFLGLQDNDVSDIMGQVVKAVESASEDIM